MTLCSIVVASHNRARSLDRCITSILADTSTVTRELVVVDNASTDDTPAVVARYGSSSPVAVRYVSEQRPGHSNARNAGIAAAEGEILVFTDDDVEVEDGWADAITAPFADPAVAGAGGRIVPRWPFDPPEWLDGPHNAHLVLGDYGAEPRELGGDQWPFGANMAARADLSRRIGFDPRLGYRNGRTGGFDETLFFTEVHRHGRVVYVPDAVVHHHIGAERVDWDRVRQAWLRGGVDLALYRRLRGDATPPLRRRVIDSMRAVRAARAQRRANARAGRPGPREAWREFEAYMRVGLHVEQLLGRFPHLSAWTIDRMERSR